MKALIEEKIILNSVSNNITERRYDLYQGEWLYASTVVISELLNFIYYPSVDTQVYSSVFGFDLSHSLSVDNRQTIRRQIRHIHGRRFFPDDITVLEELSQNLLFSSIKNDNWALSLDNYGIDTEMLCQDLSTSQRIIIEILMAINSSISLLILEDVIDLISSEYRTKILDTIHHKVIEDGLSVLISTDSNEVKNKYLGRNF